MHDSKIVRYFCLAGFVIPCLLWVGATVAKMAFGYVAGPEFVIVWPTAILTMAGEGQPWPVGLLTVVLAVFSNVVIYGLVGVAIAFLWRRRSHSS